jgi:cellulose synthase (UDP-forming)
MTLILTRPAGRHRQRAPLPYAPDDDEKYSYDCRSLTYLTIGLAISCLCLILAQAWLEFTNLLFLPFAVYTVTYTTYQAISIPINFTGRGFDLNAHRVRVTAWLPRDFPSVDIFLPICGEPLEVLCNTWAGVAEVIRSYPGQASAFVLDDGPGEDVIPGIVADFGFTYVRRPNVGFHKKSGNLDYAFWRTGGDHIVIFDADFRPRWDFLAETLPYMDDETVGVVQVPQYFRVSKRQTWVEQAAGATLEVFYRAVQVSRDRFGSALCVGSNAVYRRAGLVAAGGFTEIPYAEDSHTGLDMRYAGYQLVYLPVVLAAGVCPSRVDTFMRQQYRWCCGATSLIWTHHLWRVRMPWRSRLPYIAGWLWNLTTALRTLLLPLVPVSLLAFLPAEIQLRNAILLIPAIITGTILYPLWHNSRWTIHIWPLAVAVGWAQALAIWDFARGKVMSWDPSRGPKDATRRFRKAVCAWNGTLALLWLFLAIWRVDQTHSVRFAVVTLFGVVNLATIIRVVLPGKDAA